MTGTTVISLELAMVTLLRQPAELPPVHRRQQSAVCESCQEYKYSFLDYSVFKKLSNAPRHSDFQICRQPINENENFVSNE